jgi:hypothetical protein
MPIEAASEFPSPPVRHDKAENDTVPMSREDDFEPLWYGNARFPEDEE